MKIYTTPEIYEGEPEGLLYWLRRNSIYGDHSEKMLQDIQKCGNLMRGIRYSEDPEQMWSPNGYYEVSNVMSGEIEI